MPKWWVQPMLLGDFMAWPTRMEPIDWRYHFLRPM